MKNKKIGIGGNDDNVKVVFQSSHPNNIELEHRIVQTRNDQFEVLTPWTDDDGSTKWGNLGDGLGGVGVYSSFEQAKAFLEGIEFAFGLM